MTSRRKEADVTSASIDREVQLQRQDALQLANRHRMERAAIRSALRDGEKTIADVIVEPPECMKSMLAIDLIRQGRMIGSKKLAQIGREAARAGVNLALPIKWMSPDERRWLARRA